MWRDTLSRSAWLVAGSAAGRLLPYVMMLWLGRHLPTAEFATLAVAFAWSGVAASLTTTGLATLTAQRLALVATASVRWRFVQRVGLLALAQVTALSLLIAALGEHTIATAFGKVLLPRTLAPALIHGIAWSLTLLLVAALNGLHCARDAAVVLGKGGLLQGLGLICGFLLGTHAYEAPRVGALWGLALGSCCALGPAAWRLGPALHKAAPQSGADVDPFRGFWHSLGWTSLAAASVLPVTLLASSLVARGPDGAMQLAAFHALEQLHQLALFVPGIIGQALLPTLTVHLHQDTVRGTRRLVCMAFALGFSGLALATALAWDPSWLHALVGNPALSTPWATRWMLLHAGLALALTLLGSSLLARGLHALASGLNVLWALAFVSLAWCWSAEGAAGLQLARLFASGGLALAAGALLWLSAAPSASTLRQSAISRAENQSNE